MSNNDSILANASLPWDCGFNTPEGRALIAAAPSSLWDAVNLAETHEDETRAGDAVAEWIAVNWRAVLPVLSARFPV